MELRFQDGTSPFVFRETARWAATTDDPSVVVIQFRLAFLGRTRLCTRPSAVNASCTPRYLPGFRDSARNYGPMAFAPVSMRASMNGKAQTAPVTTPSAWWLCWPRSLLLARPATTWSKTVTETTSCRIGARDRRAARVFGGGFLTPRQKKAASAGFPNLRIEASATLSSNNAPTQLEFALSPGRCRSQPTFANSSPPVMVDLSEPSCAERQSCAPPWPR